MSGGIAPGTAPTRSAAALCRFPARRGLQTPGGAFAFGGVAHAFGYAVAWTALTGLVLVGSLVSTGLERPAAAAG